MQVEPQDLTLELNRWAEGATVDGDALFDSLYRRLKIIAKSHLRREAIDVAQQTTALVHEAYLYLSEQPGLHWRSREHFFSFAARLMRRILVDQARHKNRIKRGSGAHHLPLDSLEQGGGHRSPDLSLSGLALGPEQTVPDTLDLHSALIELGAIDPGMVQLVELRYFCGFSVPEVATILHISESTVFRQWRLAKAWLYDALRRRS